MKFLYPSPLILKQKSNDILKFPRSISILAISPNGELVCVRELEHFSLWKDFWIKVQTNQKLEDIELSLNTNEESGALSQLVERIIEAFNYMAAKKYLFFGILFIDNNILDSAITNEGIIFKWRVNSLIDMLIKYRNNNKFISLQDNTLINTHFIGQGEKFFEFENLPFKGIADMLNQIKGSFYGIMGISNDILNFTILSQNITVQSSVPTPKLHKSGRDTVLNLIKKKKFLPVAGFRLCIGLSALQFLKEWGSIELIPEFMLNYTLFKEYQASFVSEQTPLIEIPKINSLFDPSLKNSLKTKEVKKQLTEAAKIVPMVLKTPLTSPVLSKKSDPVPIKTVEQELGIKTEPKPSDEVLKIEKNDLEKPVPSLFNQNSPPAVSKPSDIAPATSSPIKSDSITLQKPQINLSKPTISLSKPSLNLDKPKIGSFSVKSIESSTNTINDDSIESSNDDVKPLFVDRRELQQQSLGEKLLNEDNQESSEIDVSKMSQEDIMKQLMFSLNAINELDKLAEVDAAVNRLYDPPSSLISKADKTGIEISESCCIIAIDKTRNTHIISEIRSMSMWGAFQQHLEGNPQVENFEPISQKEITEISAFENELHQSFIRIEQNDWIFLGLLEIQANAFESAVLKECPLDWDDIQKLIKIHQQRRENAQYPTLSKEGYIETKYLGQTSDFFSNKKSISLKSIAQDIQENPIYTKGIISGIICVGKENVVELSKEVEKNRAHFFILSNNFNDLESEDPNFEIDHETLGKMYQMIEKNNLSPVCWFKIVFGLKSLDSFIEWVEIKTADIGDIITKKYSNYINNILNSKP